MKGPTLQSHALASCFSSLSKPCVKAFGMPDDNVVIQSVRAQLTRLVESYACNICHATMCAPVKLPCGHIFCSECIRRRLTIESACPEPHCGEKATSTHLAPLPELDAALEPVRQAAIAMNSVEGALKTTRHSYLVFLSAKAPGAKSLLVDKLRQNGLPIHGTVQTLADRYNEFVLKWNANVDAAQPLSKQTVANAVTKEEQVRQVRKTDPSMAVTSFFKKSHVQRNLPPLSQQAWGNKLDDLESDVVVEGDDFETLIRKTKARKLKLKRMREAELQAQAQAKKSRSNADESPCILSPRHQFESRSPAKTRDGITKQAACRRTVVTGVCTVDVVGRPAGSGSPCHHAMKANSPIHKHNAPHLRSDGRVHSGNAGDSKPPVVAPPAISSQLVRRHRIALPERSALAQPGKSSNKPQVTFFLEHDGPHHHPSATTPAKSDAHVHFSQPIDRPQQHVHWDKNIERGTMPSQRPVLPSQYSQASQGLVPYNGRPMPYGDIAQQQRIIRSQSLQTTPLSNSSPSQQQQQLSEDVRKRIEQNRLIAIERKKLFYERQRRQQQPSNRP